ncbi:hypothetical protein Q5A_014095 [Serratia inhibens PRI-2C]|nr:hypothetical protein Q5A_014095 [Serratia inhibens PRI-2C]
MQRMLLICLKSFPTASGEKRRAEQRYLFFLNLFYSLTTTKSLTTLD